MITFSIAQLAAVILITPVIVGSAISEEKERGSLDFLRSTLLTNREIVLGKLAARLAFVFGVVLAGVPVLALTFLFGGVDVRVLAGSYVITAMTGVSLGAFSLLMGVLRDGLREVLVWVYGVTLGLSLPGLCCGCIPGFSALSPPSALLYLFVGPAADPTMWSFWINLGVFAVLHGTAAGVCTLLAVYRVRMAPPIRRRAPVRATGRKKPRAPAAADAPLPVARRTTRPAGEPGWRYYQPDDEDEADKGDDDEFEEVALPRARRPFRVYPLGAGADPFLWKERYFTGRMSMVEGGFLSGCGIAVISAVVFGLGLVVFFSSAMELDRGQWTGEAINGPLRVFVTGGVLSLGLAIGARAAGAIARERQRQTIDALLVLPVARLQILRAKALAPLIWARYGVAALVAALVVGVATLGLHPLGLIVAAVQGGGSIVLLTVVGAWLSVKCRTVARATVYFIVWVLAVCLGPVALYPLASALLDAAEGDVIGQFVLKLSPPVGLWSGLVGWDEVRNPAPGEDYLVSLLGGTLAGLLYLALAVVLAADAVRTFDKEGR